MRVLFMGTPDFAAVSLNRLIEKGYEVCAVITQPDKTNARGNKIIPGPVKLMAESKGIPVYQPASLKHGEGDVIFDEYSPDVAVVAAYGKILPPSLLNKPKFGCINIHASLLPKYRGASPIQSCIINGDTETGISIMQLDEGMDTGDIIAVTKTAVDDKESAGELFERLATIGADLLCDVLPRIESGSIVFEKQNEALATYAGMISKEMAVIDYCKPAREIVNLIRGLNPNPVARTEINGERLKVYSASVGDVSDKPAGSPYNKNGKICVVCGDSNELIFDEIQGDGGKRMDSSSFLRGHRLFD